MHSTILVLALLVAFSWPATAGVARASDSRERPVPTVGGPGHLLTSGGTALAARETAGPDTFTIYGGPDEPTEGKFQMADPGIPDWGGGNGLPGGYGGGPGAWTPIDLTYEESYWHRSQFNAANLNNNGAGNHAMWCGLDPSDPRSQGWASTPGYGNNWDQTLVYVSGPVTDPSTGQIVSLDFYFNHETQQGYDYFTVEYDLAGRYSPRWTEVARFDGSSAVNGTFEAPGLRYSDMATANIEFARNQYAGSSTDLIRIRLRFTSDGAWSDEDGLLDTFAGAVQVDDITLTTSEGTFTEDFEGEGPYLFAPLQPPFGGDFTDVYSRLTDTDPCRDNPTGLVGFLDYGQTVRNGPGATGVESTGGSTYPGINYGLPGGYVFNYTDGLSDGPSNSLHHGKSVRNAVQSPDILWDLPGPEDDSIDYSGVKLSFDVFRVLPFADGIFFLWWVRSAEAGQEYTEWRSRQFVYYGTSGEYDEGPWIRWEENVSDLLVPAPERIQIRLDGWDYADVHNFPGNRATPSPLFDNVRLDKYRIAGPAIATRDIDLAQDGFPVAGSIDVSTQSARDALDIPFSMARDINTDEVLNDPGDSIVVDVVTVIPGTTMTDTRMIWALNTNPLFGDAIRSAPSRLTDANVVSGPAGTVWSGEVEARPSATSYGALVPNRYYVDLPDVDFMYPGDVLHYYIQSTDNDGRTSTLPHDISGFGDFSATSAYNRKFQVRGLPTISDTSGTQPSILVYNEFGRPGNEAEWMSALQQLGYAEAVDYDVYTVLGATSSVSNGIGSAGAHGATSGQLGGYNHLFHFAGTIGYRILSDGEGQWGGGDKGDDVSTLRGWLDTPGARNIAHFGDGIVSGNVQYPAPFQYVQQVMGAAYDDDEIAPWIGDHTAPMVVPNAASSFASGLSTTFVTYAGCPQLNSFDSIIPMPGAEVGHYFGDAAGTPIMGPDTGVASVINPHANGMAITFPFNFGAIQNTLNRAVGLPARALLFREILGLFNAPAGGTATGNPASATRRAQLTAAPNPFNPLTVVEFTAAIGSRGSIRIYNLRGELVRTLHEGEFARTSFTWDGTDNQGAGVASGVYVVRGDDGTTQQSTKVALVK